jgi:hypothetical protein
MDKVQKKEIMSFNFSHALSSVLTTLGEAGFGSILHGLVEGDQYDLLWSVLVINT